MENSTVSRIRSIGALGIVIVMVTAPACTGAGGDSASDDYVPPIGGTWRRLAGQTGSMTFNLEGDQDPNFPLSGSISVRIPPESEDFVPGVLQDRRILVSLSGGKTVTLDIASNTQIVRQPGGESYWKSFLPDLLSGVWCVTGQPGRSLTFQAQVVDPRLAYTFLSSEPGKATTTQGTIDFVSQGTDNQDEGEEILMGKVAALILPGDAAGRRWTGDFSGASMISLTAEGDRLTLVRRRLPTDCQ
jgi:hypothetical protein